MRNLFVASGILVLAGSMLLAMPASNARAAALCAAAEACTKPDAGFGLGGDGCFQCYDDCLDNARDQLFCCLHPSAPNCRLLAAGAPALRAPGQSCFADLADAVDCCRLAEEACEGTGLPR